MERLSRLTALQAEDLVDSGRPASVAAGLASGTLTFLRAYLARGGWREGRLGFLVATLSALFPVLSQMRAGDVMAARKAAATEAAQPNGLREVVGMAR
jgi:hypothetical protein